MYGPHLDRLAASLLTVSGLSHQEKTFPNLNAWLAALNERPAYDRVKTDAATINLFTPAMGVEPIGNPLPLDPV